MTVEASGEAAVGDDRTAEFESPFAILAEALYRERVIRARRMAPEEKFIAGEELFALACSITLAGIRNQFPNANDQECLHLLKQRLALRSKREGRA
jgi:hypothetical protein